MSFWIEKMIVKESAAATLKPKACLVIVACFLISLSEFVRAQELKFRHLTIEDGLSQNTVWCTTQDHFGFLWIATKDGLNCFDGYSFKTYFNNSLDSASLSSNWVWVVYEDDDRNLWIGTEAGLDLFNRKTENFTHIKGNSKGESIGSVRVIQTDNAGNLWLGQVRNGLGMFDPRTGNYQSFKQIGINERASFLVNQINHFIRDSKGNFWLGTEAGLLQFNTKTKTFKGYQHSPSNPKSLPNNTIYSICENSNSKLWVGTSNGLTLFDPVTELFENVNTLNSFASSGVFSLHEDQNKKLWIGTRNGPGIFDPSGQTLTGFTEENGFTMSDSWVISISETSEGQLVMGTNAGGINLFNQKAKKFKSYSHYPSNPTSLSSNEVWSICEDNRGRVWVGTNNGLNLLDNETQSFEHFKHSSQNPLSISSNSVRAIYPYSDGQLLIGTKDGGLNLFHVKTKTFDHFIHDPSNPKSLPHNEVRNIFMGLNNQLYVVTRNGLSVFDRSNKTFDNYPLYSTADSLNRNVISEVIQDHTGDFWGEFWVGMFRVDYSTKKIEMFRHNPADRSTIASDFVNCITVDHLNRIWCGGNGVNLYDRKKKNFSVISKEDGLPDNMIYAILEDNNNDFWISTDMGISHYSPSPNAHPGNWGQFRNYTAADGLQDNEFNARAAYKGKNGLLYFGGVKGFNVFHPDSIKDDSFVPPIVITDVEIFNRKVIPTVDYNGFNLPSSITYSDTLKLSYRESVFTLKFSALAFAKPEKNQYKYQLEGFDNDWSYTDAKRRFATYTNLDPGSYTFRVMGSNQDGVWNEKGRTLTIIITPPWWKTWWFRSLVVFCLIFSIILFIRFRTRQIRKANLVLTETVAQKTKELREANSTLVEQEKEILAQNKELMSQAAVLEENNKNLEKAKELLEIEIKYLHQTQLFKSSIDVQEEERRRIAQNLHDELGATLSIARMHLDQLLEHGEKVDVKAGLERTKTLTETALASMRRISHALMPPHLEKYGLIAAIEDISSQLKSAQKIGLELASPKTAYRWPMSIELGLYRICMEMINNTIKYAGANRIHIDLQQTEDSILFRYADNGKGLPEKYKEGLGFKNIAARVNSLGGNFEIEKKEQKGFFAVLTIPHIMD